MQLCLRTHVVRFEAFVHKYCCEYQQKEQVANPLHIVSRLNIIVDIVE
jgi:hypothetical protein